MSFPNGKAAAVRDRFEDGDFLGMAELILPNERFATEVRPITVEWDSRQYDHFDVPLALEDVWYRGDIDSHNFTVSKARFHVFGDDEMFLDVTKNNLDFVRADEFSVDTMRTFAEVYIAHAHLICLESLRLRRQHQLAEHRSKQAQKEAKRGFRVTLNGVIQEDI